MSFFKKLTKNLKQLFKIGGVRVKVTLDNGNTISKDAPPFTGTLTFTSKEPHKVNRIVYELVMETSKTRKGETKTNYKILGTKEVDVEFEVKPNQPSELKFDTGSFYEMKITNNQDLEDMGGALKVLGKVGKALDKETVTYKLKVYAYFEGLSIGAMDTVELQYVK